MMLWLHRRCHLIFILYIYFFTVHIQDDEHFCVSTDGAGVALVSPLILNVHLCQLEWGISSVDLILEKWSPTSEALVLYYKLVLVTVVWMDTKVSFCLKPVDNRFRTAMEAARQDASLHKNTGDLRVWESVKDCVSGRWHLIYSRYLLLIIVLLVSFVSRQEKQRLTLGDCFQHTDNSVNIKPLIQANVIN